MRYAASVENSFILGAAERNDSHYSNLKAEKIHVKMTTTRRQRFNDIKLNSMQQFMTNLKHIVYRVAPIYHMTATLMGYKNRKSGNFLLTAITSVEKNVFMHISNKLRQS